MTSRIRVAILEDHQSTIDGYLYRLGNNPRLEIVSITRYGAELEAALAAHPADVLLLDLDVPTAPGNKNAYPVLNILPRLFQQHLGLAALVISMFNERALIHAVLAAGVSSYILKDDAPAIRQLGAIIETVANGGVYLSEDARAQLLPDERDDAAPRLTPRQHEALSLAAAYPDDGAAELAARLYVTVSTARNLLSGAYLRLGVSHRAAAVAKAQQLGLITPNQPPHRRVDDSQA
ncbi:MAG: response regulator transcription factor [Anaerolineales bacterium]